MGGALRGNPQRTGLRHPPDRLSLNKNVLSRIEGNECLWGGLRGSAIDNPVGFKEERARKDAPTGPSP
jgi:hypothetical protein